MTNAPSIGPTDPVEAVLKQYAGAADADEDRRFETTPAEVVPSADNAPPIVARRKHVRDALYPNLGSAGGRTLDEDSAATELGDK
jgi:hypothetical protein